MKAWILTAFYLWKDIWSRWLETPGAVLARLFVAILLAGLMLLAHAAFVLGARSLEARIHRLGARTLIVTEAVAGDRIGSGSIGELLAAGRTGAAIASFRQVTVPARDELGRDYAVAAYGPETRAVLAPLLAAAADRPVHVLNPDLPPGLPLQVTIDGVDLPALTVPIPDWLRGYAAVRPVVLVPLEVARPWLATGWFETAVLTVPADGDLVRLAEAVRRLLVLEERGHAAVQSPEGLLRALASLRATQQRAQAGAGVAGGLVIALVFGSIAVLEYRQNRYVAALLRSFGAPAALLLARHAVEAMLLTAAAVLLARLGAVGLHAALFQPAGIEPALLDRHHVDPYTWPQVWNVARWLALGAGLGLLPIALGLRQPVGRILQ